MEPGRKKGHKNKGKDNPEEVDPDAFAFSTDPLIGDIQRKAMSVFDVLALDQGGQKMVDVREVGTMSRALDLYPSEADIHEIIGIVEEPTMKGFVKGNTFVDHMTKVICEGKYKPVPHDDLIAAFRAVDREKKGLLDPAKFKEMLMKEGEAFTAEEVEEMFNFAVNKTDSQIHFEEYVDKLYRMLKINT